MEVEMRRSFFSTLAVLICLLAFASGAHAVPISIGDQLIISDHSSPTATIPGGAGGAYIATSTDYSFITFCLEINESLTYGDPFYVDGISTAAMNGGKGGAVDGKDEISSFTAWLYDQAVTGQIGYSYLDDVQYAIWFEEDEITTLSDSAQNFYNDQFVIFGTSGWEGSLGNTRVINLVDANGNARQDLLVSVNPVPEPATIMLMGSGLLGIAAISRRKIRKR